MRKEITDTKYFIEYVKDHILHFNAIPLDYEDSKSNVFDYAQVWETAKFHGLTSLISHQIY